MLPAEHGAHCHKSELYVKGIVVGGVTNVVAQPHTVVGVLPMLMAHQTRSILPSLLG